MQFKNKILQTYVTNYTSQKTRDKSNDSVVKSLVVTNDKIEAKVRGSKLYNVEIDYTKKKVKNSFCSCPFDFGPVCKHVVNVMKMVDEEYVLDEEEGFVSNIVAGYKEMQTSEVLSTNHPSEYILQPFSFADLTNTFILQHSYEFVDDRKRGFFDIQPSQIELNKAVFEDTYSYYHKEKIKIELEDNRLTLSCNCKVLKAKMCDHQAQVMYNLKDRAELRAFFHKPTRDQLFLKTAKEYGLENEKDLDAYFEINFSYKGYEIVPKLKGVFPVNAHLNEQLKRQLLTNKKEFEVPITLPLDNSPILVFGKNRYYEQFYIELLEAKRTKENKIKNPLISVNPVDFIWKTSDSEEIRFYSALLKFQNNNSRSSTVPDLEALKAIVANPKQLEVFYHKHDVSDNLTSSSVVPIGLKMLDSELLLNVSLKENFYEISGSIELDGKTIGLKELQVHYKYFVKTNGTFYLLENPHYTRVIEFFQKNNPIILIHTSKYEQFHKDILADLEDKVRIHYSYLKPATKKQIKELEFDKAVSKLIYLTDSDDYVLIAPVVKYGTTEISAFSKRQIQAVDQLGNAFIVERDLNLEDQFVSILLRQHPTFEEQLEQGYFYLHKQEFLHSAWFLDAFEQWKNNNIQVLGFGSLKDNRYSQHKANVSLSVNSGLDWFDTSVQVKFGDQLVSLKQLHKSVKNKSKYIELGDGTLGVLPEEWIAKFSSYFLSGEVVKETIRTSKMNFSEIAELYDEEVLSIETKDQLAFYKEKLNNFQSIEKVAIPTALNATLRDYQKEGLNWLNFLDSFGFGGCLADDMGLGKTIQILAFILSQGEKEIKNTNLIVVPTTLIFNWLAEVEKFAPSIRVKTIYGADRIKGCTDFDDYEIILTSYGTLLSDVRYLKDYHFNYIFLDESQAIKNPESQRYKAVRLLQSRNKIVLTGTPIENNTFDLYGQLSFACPGLLGTRQAFKDHYSIPIDKFKEVQRSVELQKKINPFLLRRTKSQVAKELPDKTEMVIYCEMGEEQRKVYDAYKDEFKAYLNASAAKKKHMDTMYILAGLTKLRQICNSPALLNDQEYYGDESAKIDVLMEEINGKVHRHKIIVFSQFVSMLELIKTELDKTDIPYEYLTGQTKNRSEKVEEFQTNDKIRVFLISLKAGGTGLNLTEADYVYLVDPWWNPAVENQAIDRCYRIGQKKNVVAVRLITPDTIEEKIMKLQASKKELVSDLIRTDANALKSFSKEDLLEMFD